MTGRRSSTGAVTAFGIVIRIEQVSSVLPLASFHRSQIPANANNSPSLTSKQYGCLALHVLCHRSEEHTSELQSHSDLVCRLLLEKKKTLHKSHCKPPRKLDRTGTARGQELHIG